MKMKHMVLVGAGMVGLSLAVGLRQQGHRVTLIERGQRPVFGTEPELRVSAIAHTSRDLLVSLDTWQGLPAQRLGPYQAMEVWDYDSFGRIQFSAAEVNQDDLGSIVENKVLEQILWDRALAAQVEFLTGVSVTAVEQDQQQVQLRLDDGREITADYLFAADGGKSTVRSLLHIPQTFWDYEQTAIVATIATSHPHQNTARQVFLPTGPVAWLPLADPNQVSLVWSADTARAQQLLALSAEDFVRELQVVSDQCLGDLSLHSERLSFPLRMQYAQTWLVQRALILGDAAHTIHPLAGQGANLGLADVKSLLKVTATEFSQRDLRDWERERKAAAVTMIGTMEAFKRGFGTPNPALKFARGLGLRVADKFAPLKQTLIKSALG